MGRGNGGYNPRAMPSQPYRTLDDVVAGLGAWESRFRVQNDRRAIFLSLYGIVSAEIRHRLARRAFDDNDWVHGYAVAFANLYREALEAYDEQRLADVPKPWRLCFDAARAGTGLVLQDMFLGVNAHVNNDLPLALASVSIDPDRPARYRDHRAVNAALTSVTERATQRLAELYAPGLTAMDNSAGQLDEMLSLFSLDVARESAWESAVALANTRNALERRLAVTLISARTATLARLLLAPSCSPSLVIACRRLESGPQWLTLFASAVS